MNIYNNLSIDQLAAKYNQLDQTIATTSFEACIIQAQVMQDISDKYNGNIQAKGYKKEARTWIHATSTSKRQWLKDAEVGRWLITNGDQPHQYRTKTHIYKALHPAKPKAPKIPVPSKPAIDLEYYKDCERKYMALMDILGDKADAILAKALKGA